MTPDGLTVASHRDDDSSWTMVHRPPHPALAGIVAGPYCGYAEESAVPFRRRQVATGRVAVIIGFGAPLDILEMNRSSSAGRSVGAFVAGLHDGYALTEHRGGQLGLQVDLTPLGARRLLGGTHEVAHECVALDDVLGADGAALVDRMAALPDWRARFDLVDALLLRRAEDGPRPDRAVTWAWHQLERSHGQVPVRLLAEEIGWSRRHFAARFRRDVGLPPKPTGRVLRFQRATGLLRATPTPSIADVAATCGYADHSHLVREFRVLAGCTPSTWAGAELPDGGGTAG